MTIAPRKRSKRESLLKVRVRAEMKEKVVTAAEALDLDQSALVRAAVLEYIHRHFPDANQR